MGIDIEFDSNIFFGEGVFVFIFYVRKSRFRVTIIKYFSFKVKGSSFLFFGLGFLILSLAVF